MLKTRKLISMVLVAAMVLSMLVVGIVAISAAQSNTYFLTGTINNWAPDDAYAFTKNDAVTDTEEYYLQGVTITAGSGLKVAMSNKSGSGFQEWYPDGVDNDYKVEETAVYDVYFRPNGDGGDDWYYYGGAAAGQEGGGTKHLGHLFVLVKTDAEPIEPTTPADEPVNPDDPSDTITIYFTDNLDWGTANVHYWGDGETSWPGMAMDVDEAENFEGHTVYKAVVPAGVAGLVFNAGLDQPQTVNVESGIADNKGWYTTTDTDDQGHYQVGEYEHDAPLPTDPADEPTNPADPTDTITIYFTDNLDWGTANVHYWGDGETSWPGMAMDVDEAENFEGHTVYKAVVPAGVAGLVFNAGLDQPQTVNVESGIADGKGWYTTTDTDDQGHYQVGEYEHGAPLPTDPSDEPTTPSDEPTVPAGDTAKISIDGQTYEAHVGDTITYTYYVNVSDVAEGVLTSVEGRISYDNTKLKLAIDLDDRMAKAAIVPNFPSCTVNEEDSTVYYNATFESGVDFDTDDSVLVTMSFEVTSVGESEIVHQIKSLGNYPDYVLMQNYEEKIAVANKRSEVKIDCPHDTPTEPQPTDPQPTDPQPTDPQPTDPQPTDPQPTQPAGDKAVITIYGINGEAKTHTFNVGDTFTVYTMMDLTGVTTDACLNAINGVQTYTDTVVKLTDKYNERSGSVTDKEAMFPILKDLTANAGVSGQIKFNCSSESSKASWKFDSSTSQLIVTNYEVVAAGNGEIRTTVVELSEADDETTTKIVRGGEPIDPNKAPKYGESFTPDWSDLPVPTEPQPTEPQPTEPQPTDPQPTEPQPTDPQPTEPQPTVPAKHVYVIADGNKYEVEQGEVINYVYYLNMGDNLCSLDAETFYDVTGLELKSEANAAALFPILGDAVTLNSTVAGRFLYNYTNENGKAFDNDDAALIAIQFTVTADEGEYEINTIIHALAGADEVKYINDKDPNFVPLALNRAEGALADKLPVVPTEPQPTEPQPTEPQPTEPQPTEPQPTEPQPTQPQPTQPQPTEPQPTEPQPTEPAATGYGFTVTTDTWTIGSTETFEFVVKNADEAADANTFDKFQGVTIDGEEVAAENYTAEAGSVKLTFNADYLDTLAVGEHTLKVLFEDGEVETTFTVAEASSDEPTTAPTSASTTKSSTSSTVTPTNSSTVKTGSTEMAIIFLVILVMSAGVVLYTKKRKFD